MGYFEDRLREKETRDKAQIYTTELSYYNNCVIPISELILKIVKEIDIKPPDNHRWLNVDGNNVACWRLTVWSDDCLFDDKLTFCYFSSYGNIIIEENGHYYAKPLHQISDINDEHLGNSEYLRALLKQLKLFYCNITSWHYLNQPKVVVTVETKQKKPWLKTLFE